MEPSDLFDGSEPADPPRRSIRRRGVIAVAVLAVAGLAYLAGAGAFDGIVPAGGDVGWEDAEWSTASTVATGSGESGVTAEVRLADVGGEECALVGVFAGAGSAVWGGRCGDPLTPWDDPGFSIVHLGDYFGALGQYPIRRPDGSWSVAMAGAVHPDVVRVTAHFGDGGQYSFVTRNQGGWFVVVVPDDIADPDQATGYLVNAPVRLELFDVDGTRVTSVELTAPVGALDV